MKLDTTHIILGQVPDVLIQNFINTIEELDWLVLDWRKSMISHEGQYDSMVFRHAQSYLTEDIQNQPLFGKYESVLTPIIDWLRTYYDVTNYVALLARLKPSSHVNRHADITPFLEDIHRVHIPLVTNPLACYEIDYETIEMPLGEAVEIDNVRWHSAWNQSTTEDRVHLIINVYGDRL